MPQFRVAGCLRSIGAQGLDVAHLKPEPAQEQLGVLQDRGVPGGQDEPVPADPVLIGRIGVHHLLIQQVGDTGQ